MNIINKNICELFDKLGSDYNLYYEDEKLNQSFIYYRFLADNDKIIMKKNGDIELKSILYSKYYWFSKFMKYYKQQYGKDFGIDQKQFELLEDLDQQLCEGVDFSIIQEIDELIL